MNQHKPHILCNTVQGYICSHHEWESSTGPIIISRIVEISCRIDSLRQQRHGADITEHGGLVHESKLLRFSQCTWWIVGGVGMRTEIADHITVTRHLAHHTRKSFFTHYFSQCINISAYIL